MATAESPTSSPVPIASAAPVFSEEDAARAVRKRHEALAAVRSKALKGKGAWYWTHLEPIVYHHPATGLAKAVKLRCSLCSAEFSASNPSRTASEHLKRGTCPNFTSSAPPSAIAAAQSSSSPRPVSSLPPSAAHYPQRARKRSPLQPDRGGGCGGGYPLAIVDYKPHEHRQPEALVLSGGKDDLEALAALESSVKRLKSPGASPCVTLTRDQVDLAMTHLADWVYECCGAVSLASLDHPRLRAFLRHLGLPFVSRADLLGARLASRYDEALRESDARTREAPFFQLASDGWGGGGIVSLVLNLPNGTSVFRRAVFVDDAKVPPGFAEDILRDTIAGTCAGDLSRCAGIVTSKFKLQALRELERRSHWMVNLPCQLRAVTAVLKDFVRDLPLFRSVLGRCRTIAHFFSTHPRSGISLESTISSSSPVANGRSRTTDTAATLVALMDDTMSSARELHRLALEDPESLPAELAKTVLDAAFWNDLGAALSLVRIAREAAHDIEAERPFVGHCLPLWNDLRSKIRSWCAKHEVPWGGPIEEVLERRFRKNYHPAWSAAYVLDPLYLTKDSADGKYLPPFRRLTPEQAADVDAVVSRLVSPEETHVTLMELMKWRSQGLERDYALAVQMKQRDPATGRMRVTNPLGSRIVWETHLREFRLLGRVAVRLIFLHATACRFKWNASFLRWIGGRRPAGRRLERAQKMAFVAANEKLKRGDISSEEEKDAKLFCNRDDDDNDDNDNEDMSDEEEIMENAAL